MKTKIMMSLMLCLILGLTIVSAMSIDNVETSYDKKSGIVNINFDATMENQCGRPTVMFYDKKDNLIGRTYGDSWICSICIYGVCNQIGILRTGTFQESRQIQLIDKKEIKGLGNLRYEIVNPYVSSLLYASGFLK